MIFGKLTAHYRALYDLLDKSEDLPQQIAKDEAKLVGANKPLPKIINKIEENRNDLTSVTAKIQKMDDEHEGLLTETRAQLRAHMEAAVKKAEAKEAKARNELSKEEEKLEKKPNISKKKLEEKRVAHAESVKELEKVKTYLEESETVELFEEIIQQDWEIIYGEGSREERFELHAAKGGVNTDRPHGYRHGGNVKFTKNDFDYAAKTADIGVKEDKREATLQGAQPHPGGHSPSRGQRGQHKYLGSGGSDFWSWTGGLWCTGVSL